MVKMLSRFLVLNTYGQREHLFRAVMEARTIEGAYEAMMDMHDWGGRESTRYMIKNMLAPLGIAVVAVVAVAP